MIPRPALGRMKTPRQEIKTASELIETLRVTCAMMDDLAKRLGSRAKAEEMVAEARRELRKEEAAWKKRRRR